MKYSIVIPCYNESSNLNKLVKKIKEIPQTHTVEFILVENGSTDNSREIFETQLDFDNNYLKKVYVDKNKGYGYGIKQGIKQATGDYIGWIHADMQFAPEKLVDFFRDIEKNNYEKVLMKGKRKNRKAIERFFTFGMGICDSIIFKQHMYEVMSMPIIFSKNLLKFINEFPDDFSIDIYVYAKCKKMKYKIVHLPVVISERENGKSSWNKKWYSRITQSLKMLKASIEIKNKIKKEEKL